MRRLWHRMRMLHELVAERPYAWTDPVQLASEVMIVAFSDRSGATADAARAFSDYVSNLMRPVVFPFLADCAQVAHLRLEERIEVLVEGEGWPVARLAFQRAAITPLNGEDVLGAA